MEYSRSQWVAMSVELPLLMCMPPRGFVAGGGGVGVDGEADVRSCGTLLPQECADISECGASFLERIACPILVARRS